VASAISAEGPEAVLGERVSYLLVYILCLPQAPEPMRPGTRVE